MRTGGNLSAAFSLRRRLIWQFVVLSAVLMLGLFFAVRFAADRASRASQDAVLGSAVISVADGMRAIDDGLDLDLPYATFSMLGATGEERIFYSLSAGDRILTGYQDLPKPPNSPDDLNPEFWSAVYRGNNLRLAAVSRQIFVGPKIEKITVVLGQTRYGQAIIARDTAHSAVWIGLGFIVLAIPLALWAARSVLRPVNRLAESVARRGPEDLSPVRHPTPVELVPMVRALNGFIARLRGAFSLAETFIFEAAHRIRTPLALVRSEVQIALTETEEEKTRQRLRRILRAIGESSRSANQILDHAMVMYRGEQFAADKIDFSNLSATVLRSVAPLAEMRDIDLISEGLDTPCIIMGDERTLEIALRNIIDNALKYSQSDATVTVRLNRRNDMAVFSVLDEGRGLDTNYGYLIGRFRRGSNVGDVVGSGLGLTIVNEVAAAHGGHFNLKSRPERGTCATLFLPLLEA